MNNLDDVLNIFCKSEPAIDQRTVLKPGYLNSERLLPYKKKMKMLKKQAKKERLSHKGKGWFNLPAPQTTKERKNDLAILQMREVMDPKHFYKKNVIKSLPKYYQVGTVIENAADFYHSRIPKRQRKRTIVEELLADANFKKYNKRKYAELQASQPTRSRIRQRKNKGKSTDTGKERKQPKGKKTQKSSVE